MTVCIVHILEMINVHHQDANIVLLPICTDLFAAKRFMERFLVDKSSHAITHSKVLAMFKLSRTIVGKASNPSKGLEQFLFMVLITIAIATFQANSKFRCIRIGLRRNRHYKQLTKSHVPIFLVIQTRNIIAIPRLERSFYSLDAIDL